MTKLIVGLGNPGSEYKNTRHNIGFEVLDYIAQSKKVEFSKSKFSGVYTEYLNGGEKVFLLKPEKYMNLSGEVIRDFIKFYKIDISDVLVIYDDMDTPVGSYKLRAKGSSGGHNGLKNIELHTKTSEYKRLKVGISRNKLIETKNYVLGKFSPEDKEILVETIKKASKVAIDFPNMTFDRLMNKYN